MARKLGRPLPSHVEIVRVPCAGRIETLYLLKAIEKGADGVLIFGCYEENCQYLRGNRRAISRLSYAHRLMESIGLEKERVDFCPLATNCGIRFSETLQEKSEALRKRGPGLCNTV
jgi:coenzyme F420-reducing hydrogenase delta subunit